MEGNNINSGRSIIKPEKISTNEGQLEQLTAGLEEVKGLINKANLELEKAERELTQIQEETKKHETEIDGEALTDAKDRIIEIKNGIKKLEDFKIKIEKSIARLKKTINDFYDFLMARDESDDSIMQ